jgi:serine/threonine protein kinase
VRVADRYRLSEVLGSGGMGEVWFGQDEVLDRPVAVKLVRIGGDGGDDLAARFELEARTAARLSHPNVVTVFDFGHCQGSLFLVMEPLDGGTVAGELSHHEGGLAPGRVASVGAQVADGLAAAHEHGVLHRDVKPANLLLAPDGGIKIGDFGIARFADEAEARLTGPNQVIGTCLYLAPERVRRPAVPASDVYGLGCVLYELLAGHPPLRAKTPIATVEQHLTATPEPLLEARPDIPARLAELITAMLAKDPADRPSAAQVAAELAGPLRLPVARWRSRIARLAGGAAAAYRPRLLVPDGRRPPGQPGRLVSGT